MNEQQVKETKRTAAMARAPTSTKPMMTQRTGVMTAAEKAATNSTTVSTHRSLMDIMPTESMEAFSTSLSATPAMEQAPKRSKFLSDIQAMIKQLMSTAGSELTRKLLQADISTECTFGLLHFTRAIQDLEPWALRLIDATAKYPTGFLQGTLSDLGAYDECIETVVRDEYGTTKVRGQYCDVHLSILDQEMFDQIALPAMVDYNKRVGRFMSFMTDKSLPGIRLGVCFIDACNEQDLANIGSIGKSILGIDAIRVLDLHIEGSSLHCFETSTMPATLDAAQLPGSCQVSPTNSLPKTLSSEFGSLFGPGLGFAKGFVHRIKTRLEVTVKDCVTNEYEGINIVQAWIIAFLAVLAAVIAGATIFELLTENWDNERKNGTEVGEIYKIICDKVTLVNKLGKKCGGLQDEEVCRRPLGMRFHKDDPLLPIAT
ncbi:hypothetical protein MTO96_007801 [Rhipicephalus appendiculatus]